MLACTVLATAYSLLKTPQYQSTAKVVVSIASATSSSDLAQGGTYVSQVVSTYTDVATTPYVLDPVIAQLKLPDTASQLSNRIVASTPIGESVIQVTASDPSPRQAAVIANAVTQRLAVAMQTLGPNSSNRTAAIRVSQVQSATPPTQASSPNTPLNVALGVLLGLILGLIAAIARSRFDTRITNAGDVERLTDYPVLGTVAYRRSAATTPLATDADTQFPRVEEFKALRSRVLHATNRDQPTTVLVTAPGNGAGTSTTAANLAIALAAVGTSVVLVDTNLRHPALATYFGVQGEPGLTDILTGRIEVDQALKKSVPGRVALLPTGTDGDEPDLLQSPRMTALIDDLSTRFQVVVLDAPPALTNVDTLALARQVDGVIVIAAVGHTDKLRLQRSLADIDDAGAWVLGLVVTLTSALPGRRSRRKQADAPASTRAQGPEPLDTQPVTTRSR